MTDRYIIIELGSGSYELQKEILELLPYTMSTFPSRWLTLTSGGLPECESELNKIKLEIAAKKIKKVVRETRI